MGQSILIRDRLARIQKHALGHTGANQSKLHLVKNLPFHRQQDFIDRL
jgi:hypothetical protein